MKNKGENKSKNGENKRNTQFKDKAKGKINEFGYLSPLPILKKALVPMR